MIKRRYRKIKCLNKKTHKLSNDFAVFFKDYYKQDSDVTITSEFSGDIAALLDLLSILIEEELGPLKEEDR